MTNNQFFLALALITITFAMVIAFILGNFILLFLFNSAIAPLFSLNPITFWQMAGLSFFLSLITGAFRTR